MATRVAAFIDRFIELLCCERSVRIVPILGKIVEQQSGSPVAKTPEHRGPRPNKRNLLMSFQMSDSQQTTVAVKFVDKKGQPAPVDGIPEWSTDNTDVLALTPAADGLSCLVQAVGPLGTGTLTLKADADVGDGVTPIVGTLEVVITGGQATTVTLEASEPVEQAA
jgi:hypothetical protein